MGAPSPFGFVAVIVCDSVGCGHAPDAGRFGDAGANTLGHVVEHESLALPNLAGLGLDRVRGVPDLGAPATAALPSCHGRMFELAPAKDTMVGHWELMGLVADRPFPVYPEGFPAALIEEFEAITGRGVLGNRPASGTTILEELGAEHLRTGALIVYTSGDSVFQVACHTDVLSVAELHDVCRQARALLTGPNGVGRVIARPFHGERPGRFERLAAGRLDLALPPPGPTVLDALVEAGIDTLGIGKIHDIFAGRGITRYRKTDGNTEGIATIVEALAARSAPFVFANLVDFDSLYGHRNDPAGYARALREFDAAVPEILAALPRDGLLVITADHGNDPTWPGTDHTREAVPLLAGGHHVSGGALRDRASFADLGATVAECFGATSGTSGESFLPELLA